MRFSTLRLLFLIACMLFLLGYMSVAFAATNSERITILEAKVRALELRMTAEEAARKAADAALDARLDALEAAPVPPEPPVPPLPPIACAIVPPSHTPHPDDPAKLREHLALLALVPVASASRTAKFDGPWSDPATWGGATPVAGDKVYIPFGCDVLFDQPSTALIKWVRADGTLSFAPDRNTALTVDTLVVTPDGRLQIGSASAAIAPDKTAVISIAGSGPIDVAADPQLLGRGVISHGELAIHGAEKTVFLKVGASAARGATAILLAAPPIGWRPGDQIVLTGTLLGDRGTAAEGQPWQGAKTEDEAVKIVSITGATVTIDRPLAFDHAQGARVANYTRNVRFETAGTPLVSGRGHFMVMHSNKADVRFAEFRNLGRTDKSFRSVDIADIPSALSDTNIQGRYSFHLHRVGLDQSSPAMVVGNTCWNAPGWCFVQHDSNAIFDSNAAYDCFGACFVAEVGTETGRWADNIAIRSIGVNVHPKDGADFNAFDQGRSGVGFWFEGRMVDSVRNVAAGIPGGYGFVYLSRIPAPKELKVDPKVVAQREKLRYLDDNFLNEPNIGPFIDNEAFAAYRGMIVVKQGPRQNHDVRTIMDRFIAWETVQPVTMEYTGHYTLRDFKLSCTKTTFLRHDTEIGLWYGVNAFDMTVVGGSIDGCERGVQMRHESLLTGVTEFRYVFVDLSITNTPEAYNNRLPQDVVTTATALQGGALAYVSGLPVFADGPTTASAPPLVVAGSKTDGIGQISTSSDWDPFQLTYMSIRGAGEQNGTWLAPDGLRVTSVDEYFADRLTGELGKQSLFMRIPAGMTFRTPARDNGLLNPSAAAPTAPDRAVSVARGSRATLAPAPMGTALDGLHARHGHVVENGDGTLTYFADRGWSGIDDVSYWVRDANGKFAKGKIRVTVQ